MKSISKLIASGKFLLVVKDVKDRSTFGLYDLAEEGLRFIQTMPRVRADEWSLSELLNLVACVSWEDGRVSIFDAADGTVKTGFRATTDAAILLYNDTIRILAKSHIYIYDLDGTQISKHRLPSEHCKDFGKYTVCKNDDRYELMDSGGESLGNFPVEGVGITSAALLSKGLVVAEGSGPITLLDETGGILWQNRSPDKYHPIAVAAGPDDEIYAVHAKLPELNRSIFTVQRPDGAVLAQQEIAFCPPVKAFSINLRSWIIGGFQTFEYKDGKFTQGRLESLKSAFTIED